MPALESLVLVPFTPLIHEQVVKLHVDREMSPPPMPKMAVAAVGGLGSVCASMYLYETDLFLFNEFLCTNPAYPARQRHAAVVLMSHAVVGLALAKGLFVMTTPRTKGGELIAKRMGFVNSGMPMWVRKANPLPLWEAEAPEPSLGPDSEAPEEGALEKLAEDIVESSDADGVRRTEKEPIPPEKAEGPKYPDDTDWGSNGAGPEPEIPEGDSWARMTDRVAGPEEPLKRRTPPAAKGRRRGKETGGEPARKTLQRVSRQGKRSGLG